jgi:hypothetical protein
MCAVVELELEPATLAASVGSRVGPSAYLAMVIVVSLNVTSGSGRKTVDSDEDDEGAGVRAVVEIGRESVSPASLACVFVDFGIDLYALVFLLALPLVLRHWLELELEPELELSIDITDLDFCVDALEILFVVPGNVEFSILVWRLGLFLPLILLLCPSRTL